MEPEPEPEPPVSNLADVEREVNNLAHALCQIYGGGNTGEAAFSNKVAYALDKLFRSFGRAKPGRGCLNYPEFAGAMRNVASSHGLSDSYVDPDVLSDLFMHCDQGGSGYVADHQLRDFLVMRRRARKQRARKRGEAARRRQQKRFKGPPPRRGQRLPWARKPPRRAKKVAAGLGVHPGGGVRGRRRRPKGNALQGQQSGPPKPWHQQRGSGARRRAARGKAGTVSMAHVRCAPMARRLLAAQPLLGWAKAFAHYDRTRKRCMQFSEFKKAARAAFAKAFPGEEAELLRGEAVEELRELFSSVDSNKDGFIGTAEFKAFLVACTSVFLGATAPTVTSDSDPNTSGAEKGTGELAPLLRPRRRPQESGAVGGWMAPTAASQGRNSVGSARPLRRRSQGNRSESRGRVTLKPIEGEPSFLKPTARSKLGARRKHKYDNRDLKQKHANRRAASAMAGEIASEQDSSNRRASEGAPRRQPPKLVYGGASSVASIASVASVASEQECVRPSAPAPHVHLSNLGAPVLLPPLGISICMCAASVGANAHCSLQPLLSAHLLRPCAGSPRTRISSSRTPALLAGRFDRPVRRGQPRCPCRALAPSRALLAWRARSTPCWIGCAAKRRRRRSG